jgi:hypothetical protein
MNLFLGLAIESKKRRSQDVVEESQYLHQSVVSGGVRPHQSSPW